jgi:hypothetical protein
MAIVTTSPLLVGSGFMKYTLSKNQIIATWKTELQPTKVASL